MTKILKFRYEILLGVLLCIAAGLYLFNLGEKGLWSAQEARNALAAQNIIGGSTVDWIMPEIALERSTQKPVLFYWLVAISCMIGNSVSELYVRLPAALSGLLCALYIFYLGQRLFNRKTGLLAAIVLSSCTKFLSLSRTSRIDIFLTLCLVVILGECLLVYLDKKRYHLVIAYIMAALAVLAKGPVGVIIPVGVLLGFCVLNKRIRNLRLFISLPAVVVFLVLVLPYYAVAAKVTGGDFLYDFLIKHNIERFTGLDGTFGGRKPVWYYFPNFLAGALPWSLFIPLLFSYFKCSFKKSWWFLITRRSTSSQSDSALPADVIYTYLAICFSLVFVFFSLSSFKRGDYILPVYPFFAMMLACCLADESHLIKYIRWLKWGLYGLMTVMGIFFLLVLISSQLNVSELLFNQGIIQKYFNNNDRTMLEAISLYARQHTLILALLFISAIGSIWYVIKTKKDQIRKIVVVLLSIILVVYAFYFASIEPTVDNFCTLKPFAEQINEAVGDHDLVMFHFWNHSLAFYLDRKLISIYFYHELEEYASANEDIYFVVEQKWFDQLSDTMRQQTSILARTPEYHRKKLILCLYPAN